MKILAGHTSPETAYVVNDYPYGFRLRCMIRYWLEYRKGKGFRFVSQTTNPKRSGEFWNKPKASTYTTLAVMVLKDENAKGIQEVTWQGLHFDIREHLESFIEQFGNGFDKAQWDTAEALRAAVKRYNEKAVSVVIG